jgi:hypothetical protein
MHRFFPLVLSWDFPGGRAYFISPRIGRTYPGPPPEVEGLVITKMGSFVLILLSRFSWNLKNSRDYQSGHYLLSATP